MSDILFSPLELRNITLANRLIRSATYEGQGSLQGEPKIGLRDMYQELSRGGVGTIITGFVYTSQQGRAMQQRQCGIDNDSMIEPWHKVIAPVLERYPETKLFMQIAHAGRQTLRNVTGMPVVGVSSRKCSYFRQAVTRLKGEFIQLIIAEFGEAALRAKKAGFHGVQIHAAHGYLIHQFLSPWTNNRDDQWGDPPAFLENVVIAIKERCGSDYPILVKLSSADDRGLTLESTVETTKRLATLAVDAVEVSYGTMEYALNIIRGACPVDLILDINPLFNHTPHFLRSLWKLCFMKSYLKRFLAFQENYNREAAMHIKKATGIPVITVGGLRTRESMVDSIARLGLDAVALCRPFLREPDLPQKIKDGRFKRSKCTNCNLCTIYCDSPEETYCHIRKRLYEKVQDI